jgi:hypothetical protein
MKTKQTTMPVFKSESDEADWWVSEEGRSFIKEKSAGPASKKRAPKGSQLVGKLNKAGSVQIALRLPEADLAEARRIAMRKGTGYQTLLKMMVHEGLRREAGRQ